MADTCTTFDFGRGVLSGMFVMGVVLAAIFFPFWHDWLSQESRLRRYHKRALDVRAAEFVGLGLSYEVAAKRAETALRDEAEAVLREIGNG